MDVAVHLGRATRTHEHGLQLKQTAALLSKTRHRSHEGADMCRRGRPGRGEAAEHAVGPNERVAVGAQPQGEGVACDGDGGVETHLVEAGDEVAREPECAAGLVDVRAAPARARDLDAAHVDVRTSQHHMVSRSRFHVVAVGRVARALDVRMPG